MVYNNGNMVDQDLVPHVSHVGWDVERRVVFGRRLSYEGDEPFPVFFAVESESDVITFASEEALRNHLSSGALTNTAMRAVDEVFSAWR